MDPEFQTQVDTKIKLFVDEILIKNWYVYFTVSPHK